MVDKWARVADVQLKLGSGSGMRGCANVGVVEGEGGVYGKGLRYLEIALDQAEKTRGELYDENARLRRLVVGAVNDVQAVLHLAKSLWGAKEEEVRVVLSIVRSFIYFSTVPTV
jgi:hypothetical protein